MKQQARVSVIIPTYNRASSLRRTLDSVARQTYPSERIEAIVVDDGSTDDTPRVASSPFPFDLQYCHQANQGDAHARNLGASRSKGEILVFLDDDITLQDDAMVFLVQEHETHARVIVIGPLLPSLPGDSSPFQRLHASRVGPRAQTPASGFVPFTECLSGFLSVRPGVYREIGMMRSFADGGASVWCDVDFAYRAHQYGIHVRRSPRAVAYHHDAGRRDLRSACTRWERAARVAVPLLQEHPDLESHLPMFGDKGPISLRDDSPALLVRKIGRAITAWRPVLWSMEQVVRVLERIAPQPALLRPVYRWVISSYIYRGYRQGQREYGPVENR